MFVQEGFLLVENTWHVAEIGIETGRLVRHVGETYDLLLIVYRISKRFRTVWKGEVDEVAVAVKKCMKSTLICSQKLTYDFTFVIDVMCITLGNWAYSGHDAIAIDKRVRDAKGFVLTGRELMAANAYPRVWKESREPLPLETSVPGAFAAGDVRAGAMNRVASAVGEGAMLVRLAHEYLALI